MSITRRRFLTGAGSVTAGVAAALSAAGARRSLAQAQNGATPSPENDALRAGGHNAAAHSMRVVGECSSGTLDPERSLTDFNWGDRTTDLPGGRTLREYDVVAVDKEIEIAPGVYFPAWTYNERVPGPTIRAKQGDRIRVNFLNQGSHPHTIHFHGIHTAAMDGAMPADFVYPGERFVYEFDAAPFGLHLYHCHAAPLKRHIHKGLYGAFIVDPPSPRERARELVMVMNGFDTNFDGENEVYAVNSVAHHHMRHPIRAVQGELVRIYLVNVTEFDPVNSFHLHANFFYENRTGTTLTGDNYTDTIMLCQGERSILELRFPYTGKYMFHAHQSEFAELGWMGLFDVVEGGAQT